MLRTRAVVRRGRRTRDGASQRLPRARIDGISRAAIMGAVSIVDFGMGNMHSVVRQLARAGVAPRVASRPEDVSKATKIILPGVGHFGQAMKNLRERDLIGALDDARARAVPILGICLGMHLMMRRSEEGDADGLGWIDAEVSRVRVPDSRRFKLPHVGWTRVARRPTSVLFEGIDDETEFYFVHSYAARVANDDLVVAETEYGSRFPSAIEVGNLFGVQFHPEKSRDSGARLLRNFLAV
jgi:imidazole glycerol-phosphate synthase subunit HisH